MKIQEIQIKGLFGKKDIRWKLNPQVNVLVGVNGSGKSTILGILSDILLIRENKKNAILFNSSEVSFTDGSTTEYAPIPKKILDNLSDSNISLGGILLLILAGAVIAAVASSKSNPSQTSKISKNDTDDNQPKNIKPIIKAISGTNNKEHLHIDLIEANLTNSNANHIIQKSNQQLGNVLDMEISNTIHEFNKIADSELIDRLSSSLNVFFNQIDKHVSYENNELIYTDTQLQTTLNYSNLSSGERQLIYILLRVALSNGDKSKTAIILMDEPEISLHLDWQEHFIKQLTILNPDAQFIIVTHSPALIMNGWNDVYVDMEEITTWL